MPVHQTIQIGLLGCGTVGGGVVHILKSNAAQIEARAGAEINIRRIAVRDVTRSRGVAVEEELLTDDAEQIVHDAEIDVVVELIGGVDPARRLITAALQNGKHVVTANKEVIARYGTELLELAARHGVGLFYEASVAGGIPIIRPLRACLAANRVNSVMGIINGTTNYMLTRMSDEGRSFDEMLQEAQRLGYAEADPSSDVEGYDAAFKVAILAALAFDTEVDVETVHCEGITRITPEDIQYGRELGYKLKLLAIAREEAGGLDVRVHPTFIPAAHPLAAVNDVFNAIFVSGDAVGELMFYGRGAGALPTGSAVVADIIDAVRQLRSGGNHVATPPRQQLPLISIEDTVSRYYVSLRVVDKPGVLGRIASAFGDAGVSLDSVIQKGHRDDPVHLVVVTHVTQHANVRRALTQISEFEFVHNVSNVIRVEEPEQ